MCLPLRGNGAEFGLVIFAAREIDDNDACNLLTRYKVDLVNLGRCHEAV